MHCLYLSIKLERRCSKCNLKVGIGDKEIKTCRRCKTEFDYQCCSCCGQYVPTTFIRRDRDKKLTSRCIMCDRLRLVDMYQREALKFKQEKFAVYTRQHEKYKAFVNTIIPTLQHDKYMVVYNALLSKYRRCPICGEFDISCQFMLISPKDGGKYCVNNVILVCNDCLDMLEKDDIPFISIHPMFNKRVPDETYYNNLINICNRITTNALSSNGG